MNILWPRGSSNPQLSSLPQISVPGVLGGIPIFETTLFVIVVVGAVYYLIALRRGPAEPAA